MYVFDFMGSAVCHRIAERSFIYGNGVFPVCARCTGIFSGVAFSMVFFLLAKRFRGNMPYDRVGMLFAALSFLPIAIDGIGSYLGFWESNNLLRVVTGALAGASLPGILLLGANVSPTEENILPIFRSWREQVGLTAVTLLWSGGLWLSLGGHFLPSLVIALGIVSLYALLLHLLLRNLVKNKKTPVWLLAFGGSFFIIIVIGGWIV